MKLKSSLTRIFTATLFVSALFFTSCNKEISGDGLTPQEEEQASLASSEAEYESDVVFNDVFDNVMGVDDNVGMAGVGIFARVNSGDGNAISARGDSLRCFTVTKTHLNAPNFFPVQIVIDFGTGCTGPNGVTRSGKIITTYTNRLVVPGAKATTTFDNYKVNGVKVEGTHIITNMSTANERIFKIEVIGAKLTKPNGNWSEWNSTRTIKQLEGLGTPNFPLDDIYKITGSANGKVKRGDLLFAWRSEITEPLIKKFTCRWIVKGIFKVIRLNLASTSPWVATLNYGNGSCDNQAILTINGVSHQITLP